MTTANPPLPPGAARWAAILDACAADLDALDADVAALRAAAAEDPADPQPEAWPDEDLNDYDDPMTVDLRDAPAGRRCRPGIVPAALAALAALAVIAAGLALTAHLVTFDHLPGIVAGVSVGTNNHYCSVDLTRDALSWGCESAR